MSENFPQCHPDSGPFRTISYILYGACMVSRALQGYVKSVSENLLTPHPKSADVPHSEDSVECPKLSFQNVSRLSWDDYRVSSSGSPQASDEAPWGLRCAHIFFQLGGSLEYPLLGIQLHEVFFSKIGQSQHHCLNRVSWGNQLPTLVIYPSVYPSIHPSISPPIHPPIQVPTQCRALCWALRLRKLGLVPNSRVPMVCQGRWIDRT